MLFMCSCNIPGPQFTWPTVRKQEQPRKSKSIVQSLFTTVELLFSDLDTNRNLSM